MEKFERGPYQENRKQLERLKRENRHNAVSEIRMTGAYLKNFLKNEYLFCHFANNKWVLGNSV